MSSVSLLGDTSGSVLLQAPAIAGSTTVTLPSTSMTVYAPELDMWFYTGNASVSSGTSILTGWSRQTRQFTYVGTGMSQSSGIWTFPSAGTYLVTFNLRTHQTATREYIGAQIVGSTDSGSTYSTLSAQYSSLYSTGSSTYCSVISTTYVTVTNASTQRVKFNIDVSGSITVDGVASDYNQTYVTFQKVSA